MNEREEEKRKWARSLLAEDITGNKEATEGMVDHVTVCNQEAGLHSWLDLLKIKQE